MTRGCFILGSSSCGHRPSGALQALDFPFGAQHTQSSGTAGCVTSSFRAETGVSPWLQPSQVEQNDCQVLSFERISDVKIMIHGGSPVPSLLQALW